MNLSDDNKETWFFRLYCLTMLGASLGMLGVALEVIAPLIGYILLLAPFTSFVLFALFLL